MTSFSVIKIFKNAKCDIINLPAVKQNQNFWTRLLFSASQIIRKLSESGILNPNEVDEDFNEGDSEDDPDNDDEQGSGSGTRHSRMDLKQAVNHSFVPRYVGETNAFAIQLFCIEEKYDSRSLDFLEKAFEAFPDKDFCLVTLPPNVPEFALVQHFLRVTPRETNKISQELYVFHRAGLVKSFEVRAAKQSDYDMVERLARTIQSRDSIMTDLDIFLKSRKDPSGLNVEAYVAQVMGRVVGVAIIRPEEDIEYLRSNYNIDDFILYTHHRREEHGHIHHFALVPIFSYLTKYFLREILRKSNKTSLYYPIYPKYAPDAVAQKYSLITALNFMVPVHRRTQIEYNVKKLGVNMPSNQVLKPAFNYFLPFSLNHINRKLLLEPKVAVNLRIVVVGASDVGMSFLENLIFRSHLRFNNVTLVTINGLPGALAPDELRDNLRAEGMNYSHADYAAMSLRSWVNVIHGQMTSIDRRKKHIVINARTVLPYDHLILCAGEQYYPVAPLRARVYNAYSKQEVKPHVSRPLFDTPPANMFVINTEQDAENFLIHATSEQGINVLNREENVVFYGLDLNALCAVQTMLSIGVNSNRIKIFCEKDVFF